MIVHVWSFYHNSLVLWQIYAKHSIVLKSSYKVQEVGGDGMGRKNSFYEGVIYGMLPLFNKGGSLHFLLEKLGKPCIILQK